MIVYHFLDRYGYINFGVQPDRVDEDSGEKETSPMVLVVGAGASGLAALMRLTKLVFIIFI